MVTACKLLVALNTQGALSQLKQGKGKLEEVVGKWFPSSLTAYLPHGTEKNISSETRASYETRREQLLTIANENDILAVVGQRFPIGELFELILQHLRQRAGSANCTGELTDPPIAPQNAFANVPIESEPVPQETDDSTAPVTYPARLTHNPFVAAVYRSSQTALSEIIMVPSPGGNPTSQITNVALTKPNPQIVDRSAIASEQDGQLPHATQSAPTQVLYEQARMAASSKTAADKRRVGVPSQRRPWTTEEENALMEGLDRVKGPHWSQILNMFGPNGTINETLKDRNQVQLKDKARNLKLFFLKSGIEVPYYLKYVTGDLKSRAPAQASKNEARETKERQHDREDKAYYDGAQSIMALANGDSSTHASTTSEIPKLPENDTEKMILNGVLNFDSTATGEMQKDSKKSLGNGTLKSKDLGWLAQR